MYGDVSSIRSYAEKRAKESESENASTKSDDVYV